MATWTNRGALRLSEGTFDADNLTLALLTVIPFDATARDWNTAADLQNELPTGEVSNYNRTAMGTATFLEDDANDGARIDYVNTPFGNLVTPVTPTLGVVACAAIRISTDELMWVQEFVSGVIPNGTPFTVNWDALGAAFISTIPV